MVWWQTDDKCYLTELNVAGDALVREGGPRHLGLDVPEPRARQEAVRVLGVVDGHEERPRPVQFGQLQVQVGVVRLGEHALPPAHADLAELAAEVALPALAPADALSLSLAALCLL